MGILNFYYDWVCSGTFLPPLYKKVRKDVVEGIPDSESGGLRCSMYRWIKPIISIYATCYCNTTLTTSTQLQSHGFGLRRICNRINWTPYYHRLGRGDSARSSSRAPKGRPWLIELVACQFDLYMNCKHVRACLYTKYTLCPVTISTTAAHKYSYRWTTTRISGSFPVPAAIQSLWTETCNT